jgi:ubiquinone/menaquinone biosynthesis C-methylase UbiE
MEDDEWKGLPRRKHGEVLREILPLEGARVLDIGCGDGALVRLMTREGARVTGVECSGDQLERARGATPAGDEDYLFAFGESLPVSDQAIDIAIYFNALHHVPVEAQPRALAEAHRVLRDGGLLYMQEPIAVGAYFELVRGIEDETFVRAKALEAIRQAVAEGLYREEREYSYLFPLRFAGYDAFEQRVIAVDRSREERVTRTRTSLRDAFEAAAIKRDDAFWFDNPARLNLLRKI